MQRQKLKQIADLAWCLFNNEMHMDGRNANYIVLNDCNIIEAHLLIIFYQNITVHQLVCWLGRDIAKTLPREHLDPNKK